ncbi:MAG: F0F1 ATP synthase subunit gamma [Candidatus Paceibacterota bacterium]
MKSYLQHKQIVDSYNDVSETIKTLEKISTGELHNLKKQREAVVDHVKIVSALYSRLISIKNSQLNNKNILFSTNSKGLTIIVTGKLSLVGELWHKLYNFFLKTKEENKFGHILVLGEKGKELWSDYVTENITFRDLPEMELIDVYVNSLANELSDFVSAGIYDTIDIVYLKSNSVTDQVISKITLYPIAIEDNITKKDIGYPIIDGSIDMLLKVIIEKYLAVNLYDIFLETAVSAHAARTVTLEHSAAKTEELIKVENQIFRRERRRINTEKQLEQFAVMKGL